MQWQDLAIGSLIIISGAGGWFLKTLWNAVEALREGLSDLEKSIPNVYARRDDVRDMLAQVLHAVNRLHDEVRTELRAKADK